LSAGIIIELMTYFMANMIPLVPGAQAVPAGLLPLPLAFPWADGI